MKPYLWVLLATGLASQALATTYPDRLVWVFGWNLSHDRDTNQVAAVLDTAAQHGLNGAVVSFGLDALSLKPPAFFRRLKTIQAVCQHDHLALIPAVFSVGYGGAALAHDRNLAEGLPVVDAPFVVHGHQAQFVPNPTVKLVNGGFERFHNNRFPGFNFCDQPGEVSFADTTVKHDGRASLRLEHFRANRYGHGRVMQEVHVHPQRCYRVSLWVKADGLRPAGAFRILVLADNRELAPREFHLPATTGWHRLSMLFNSTHFKMVRLYAGVWGGRSGRVWIDDWRVEEVGPLNVLHRPGTPVMVRSADGSVTYTEGRDYAPLTDPHFNFSHVDRPAATLHVLPGGRIHDGEHLLVSWYHPMVINDGQVTVCMAAPELYRIFDQEAKRMVRQLHPPAVLLSMDEIRMGGTCRACAGRNLGELLGECITKEAAILRRYDPGVRLYIWSDMLDPNHNAHANYYLAQGDFSGSWNHIPRDLIIAVWGGAPRPKSLRFFADHGFATLVSCYYDADNLDDVRGWLKLAHTTRGVRGFMYTPWQKKYGLLPAFGDLLQKDPP